MTLSDKNIASKVRFVVQRRWKKGSVGFEPCEAVRHLAMCTRPPQPRERVAVCMADGAADIIIHETTVADAHSPNLREPPRRPEELIN